MPIYTYRCENCGVQFERQQSFKDQPLTRCPECGKKTLHKVYTSVGIIFKGSGFYATDHRSPSGGRFAQGEKNGEKPAEAKGETKSETKGDAKNGSKVESKKEAAPKSDSARS